MKKSSALRHLKHIALLLVFLSIASLAFAQNLPIANDNNENASEDTPLTTSVTDNDTDPDGDLDPTTVSIVMPASNGTFAQDICTGAITYIPDLNFNGQDSYAYQVCDLTGLCAVATVSVIVDPVNDPPVANDDSATTPEDTPVNTDVTANDADVDGNIDPTTVTVTDLPANGTTTVNPNGTITYTPDPSFSGTDTFTYVVCDDGTPLPALCDEATVTIEVTPAFAPIGNTNAKVLNAFLANPIANNDSGSTPTDTPVTIPVSSNDVDPDGNLDPTSVMVTTPPSSGTIVNNNDGTLTYTPDPCLVGTDEFEYQIFDTDGNSDIATVTVELIRPNQPPIANEDFAATVPDSPVTGNVLSNDTDLDGNNLIVNTTLVTPPSNGMVMIDTDGTFTYAPNLGFSGIDSFEYRVCDDGSPIQCDEAKVEILIIIRCIVTDVPLETNCQANIIMNYPIDFVVNGYRVKVLAVNGPVDGNLRINPNASTFNAEDLFDYEVNKNLGNDPFTGDTFIYSLLPLDTTPCICPSIDIMANVEASTTDKICPPTIPTLSEWALLILGLLLLAYSVLVMHIQEMQHQLSPIEQQKQTAFPWQSYLKQAAYSFPLLYLLTLLGVFVGWGELSSLDVFGGLVSSLLTSFIVFALTMVESQNEYRISNQRMSNFEVFHLTEIKTTR